MVQQLTAQEKNKSSELVAIENRIAIEMQKYDGLKKQNEQLQAQIDQKRADYDNYVNVKDAESKGMHSAAVAQREKLESDKAEFVHILQDLQTQKSASVKEKELLANERSVLEQGKENLRQCIIAIQRAVTLVGI